MCVYPSAYYHSALCGQNDNYSISRNQNAEFKNEYKNLNCKNTLEQSFA